MIGDIEVRAAGRRGLGVFAKREFRAGEFIFRRRYGRVVSTGQIATLGREDRRHLCELDFHTSAVLLPPGSYLNHSCDPNAMRSGVKVFARRRIRRGEEITIDYRLKNSHAAKPRSAAAPRERSEHVVQTQTASSLIATQFAFRPGPFSAVEDT